jgi:hypothetical protein
VALKSKSGRKCGGGRVFAPAIMITPNPTGMVRCLFWDKLALAKASVDDHWSFDEAAKRESLRKARAARSKAKLQGLADMV